MSVIKINAITVDPESGDELAHRFAARAGAVDAQEGFEGFELLKPTDDRNTWLVVTRWRDEEAFNAWLTSPAFAHGHRADHRQRARAARAPGPGTGTHTGTVVLGRARSARSGCTASSGPTSWRAAPSRREGGRRPQSFSLLVSRDTKLSIIWWVVMCPSITAYTASTSGA